MNAIPAPSVLWKRFSGIPQASACTDLMARVAETEEVSRANRANASSPMLSPCESFAECAIELSADSLIPRSCATWPVELGSSVLL